MTHLGTSYFISYSYSNSPELDIVCRYFMRQQYFKISYKRKEKKKLKTKNLEKKFLRECEERYRARISQLEERFSTEKRDLIKEVERVSYLLVKFYYYYFNLYSKYIFI